MTIHRQNKIITRRRISVVGDRFEWGAVHEGDEDTQHCGVGATEAEAIADLKRMDDEWAEAMDRGEP